MSDADSVTAWIDGLKGGEAAAADHLWHHFYSRLVALARQRLGQVPRRAADEEDVVVSAFDTFFRGAAEGRFPHLHDRDDLWHLLVTITERKALNLLRDQHREKRGGGRVRGDSAFLRLGETSAPGSGMDQLPGAEPTPEFAAAMSESLSQLLGLLDDHLRQIAVFKLEGWTNKEIAALIERSVPTVERALRLVRAKWTHQDPGA